MNKQEKRILLALETLDDKYLEQARPRGRKNLTSKTIAAVACIVIDQYSSYPRFFEYAR